MNTDAIFAELHGQLIAIALTLPRLGASFLILPLFQQDTVPAMLRNSLIVTLAISIFPMAVATNSGAPIAAIDWPVILVKEFLIGAALGFLFGSVFWALGMAGSIVDSQSGATMASIIDPIQGHQTSLMGQLFSRFAAWLLMASGGFMVFLNLALTSYKLWPVTQTLPQLPDRGLILFVEEFGYIIKFGLMMAAPAIVVLAMIDLGFGLVNRYAQNFNVSSIAASIKYFAGIGVLLLGLGVYVEIVLGKIRDNSGLLERLVGVFVGG